MLSPEQFNKIALKVDTDRISADLGDFKTEMREFRSEVLKAIDGLAKVVNDSKSESAANLGAHDRFETRINHLEKTLL